MHFHKSLVDKYQKAYCEIFFFLKRFSVDDSCDMWRFYGNHPLGARFECGTEINATCDNN